MGQPSRCSNHSPRKSVKRPEDAERNMNSTQYFSSTQDEVCWLQQRTRDVEYHQQAAEYAAAFVADSLGRMHLPLRDHGFVLARYTITLQAYTMGSTIGCFKTLLWQELVVGWLSDEVPVQI